MESEDIYVHEICILVWIKPLYNEEYDKWIFGIYMLHLFSSKTFYCKLSGKTDSGFLDCAENTTDPVKSR